VATPSQLLGNAGGEHLVEEQRDPARGQNHARSRC
jgi:hypothetical protein